jgi:uncharacterized protein YgbK (DUF1537 family)
LSRTYDLDALRGVRSVSDRGDRRAVRQGSKVALDGLERGALRLLVTDAVAEEHALLCDEELASIPVIVVSASGRPTVATVAEAMRAAAGMVKPVDGDELLRVVDTHCRPTLP